MADGFVPPQAVRNNAKRGLELREKHGRGGTAIGVARARDLSNGKSISLSTINRMVSYFARHEVDKKGEGWGVDSAGYIAWLLWGGDAGKSWANGIAQREKKKDKSTMTNLTTAFFDIVKAEKNADGTLMVYGKATDDSLDIDQQICDPLWLDTAMPDWFKTGGNIREQHSNIAAGVAKEYEKKSDGHYIHALVVDPVSVKKVDTGVLKGFSIGIKNPRVVRDQKAANGRIIDGQIVEVSLVDRPANPNCQLVLAKSAEGENGWWKVEELIEKEEKKPNYESINAGGGGSEPADKELYNRVKAEAKRKFDVYPSAVANAWVVREYKKRGGTYKKKTKKAADTLQLDELTERKAMDLLAEDIIDMSKSYANGDLVKFDKKTYDNARQALAQLITIEAEEMGDGNNEESSLSHLIAAVHHLFAWYEGEEKEGEVMEEKIEMSAHKDKMMPKEGESMAKYKARCKEAGMDDETIKSMCDKYFNAKANDKDDKEKKSHHKDDKEDVEKSADVAKCLECGCNQPGTDHGLKNTNDFANVAKPSNVSTAEMYAPGETPKSAEADETPAEEKVEAETTEPADAEVSEEASAPSDVEAIVEKAVKSATESIRAEVVSLISAKEAAETKAASLESELANAKSLAVAGGPKRTAKPVDSKVNDNLTKAAMYRAKANATTDPLLVKGYKALAEKFATAAESEAK